ncbi:MAG: hypothetical protein LBQ31_04935 [Bacteroidales bacterium]|jgi:hypothetical protein|nr:hypothetical protein [Bacteroidales bacterium]
MRTDAGVGLSAAKSRVSEGRGRACADYAERERFHCEAIIPNAAPHPVQLRIISYELRILTA